MKPWQLDEVCVKERTPGNSFDLRFSSCLPQIDLLMDQLIEYSIPYRSSMRIALSSPGNTRCWRGMVFLLEMSMLNREKIDLGMIY
jgi:hypothetical protein